jgi:glycosyltransferase involved in cell wall biosynthesis
MKVAIAHDFLVQNGGAEKVVEEFHGMFPDAPVYTSVYSPEIMPSAMRSWDIRTSFMQKLPLKKISHRVALPLYPLAFESFDMSDYDLVISSSSAFAKGVITRPDALHLCYVHTPMRYGWMHHAYLERENMPALLRLLLAPTLHKLRTWDAVAQLRVDEHIANSSVVADRIQKYYRRDCDIIYPPVDTERFTISETVGDYYLVAARFAPYKRLDLAIEACNKLKRPLKVVGSGRQDEYLRSLAGPTVEFLGRVPDAQLTKLMAECKAYIMPGQEDFGISPVEANACGRPVIAYAAGGALDSQLDGASGILFGAQTVESLCEAIVTLECTRFNPALIRAHAQQFDSTVFRSKVTSIIDDYFSQRSNNPLNNRTNPQ